jgi:quinol monooxygenase YgiN
VSVVVVATVIPKADQIDAVREAFLVAVPQVHDEPGCELYALHEGDGRLVMIERWASVEALDVHGRTETLRTLGAALADKLAGPLDVRRLTAVPAGDPDKGVL